MKDDVRELEREAIDRRHAVAKRTNGGRARSALLLWLVALAATGYVGYRYVDWGAVRTPWHSAHGAPSAPSKSVAAEAPRVQAPEAPTAVAPAEDTAQAAGSTPSSLDSAERLHRVEDEVARLGADIAARAPDQRAWRLAELDYLLRIADHRARLEHDGAGASAMLDAAADLLGSIDDRALDPVRVAVDASRQTLANAPRVDIDAIHDRLAALRQSVAVAPVKLPKYVPAQATPSPDATHDALSRLLARLGSLVDFRSRDASQPPPLLRADDERYLRLNLMLITEEADVAALRRDDAAYRKSLVELDTAAALYFEPSDDRVARIRDEIAALERLPLAIALPDLSGALHALEASSAGRSGAGASSAMAAPPNRPSP